MNEEFEKWWTERKGVGYTGFGKSRDGVYLTEFVRDAYAAWCYAYTAGQSDYERSK